jgi:hypothetical protein
LATNTFDIAATVAIYPNPTNNHAVTISSDTTIDAIQLVTINGQILQQINKPVFENNTYALENLPQGFYFLKLTSNNQSVTKKVMVN